MFTARVDPVAKNPITLSYLVLRSVVGWVALGLPVALMIMWSFSAQQSPLSISGYYYTAARNLFVGSLCAIATFQASCRGYDRKDEIAGILSGICALGVAFFPTSPERFTPSPKQFAVGIVHLTFASALFLILAYFCLFLFRTTAKDREMTRRKVTRNKVYLVCGWIIVASIAMILLYGLTHRIYVFGTLGARFFFETTALLAFGFAWLVKGETFLKDEEAPGSTSQPDQQKLVAQA